MRVRSSIESSLRQAALLDRRVPKPSEPLATAAPVSTERDAANAAPVTASASTKMGTRSPQQPGAVPARSSREASDDDSKTQAGFTQGVEGSKHGNSMDRLEISSAARRKSADEGLRADTDAKQAVTRVATTSPTQTAMIASTLDLRV